MIKWWIVVLGALTFFGLHEGLLAGWSWFQPASPVPAWFTNSASAVVVTVAIFAIVSALVSGFSARRREETLAIAANITGGAVAMMLLLLFRQPWGPGDLFPIAIVIGAGIIFVGSIGGSLAGWGGARLWRAFGATSPV
jgi:hypothetical protein